jgi:hypothetical protein
MQMILKTNNQCHEMDNVLSFNSDALTSKRLAKEMIPVLEELVFLLNQLNQQFKI